jgi:DNA-binding PadR family transcriptional regulator
MFHRQHFPHGPRAERMFHKGDFKYLILDFLKDKPSYGYEIIQALEGRFHGFYSPSAGVVYPTLQLLEEMGYVTSSQQDGKKVYTITEGGRKFLAEREQVAEEIKNRTANWWNPEIHEELHQMMHELGELGRLLAHQSRKADAAKLHQVRDIIRKAKDDVEATLGK